MKSPVRSLPLGGKLCCSDFSNLHLHCGNNRDVEFAFRYGKLRRTYGVLPWFESGPVLLQGPRMKPVAKQNLMCWPGICGVLELCSLLVLHWGWDRFWSGPAARQDVALVLELSGMSRGVNPRVSAQGSSTPGTPGRSPRTDRGKDRGAVRQESPVAANTTTGALPPRRAARVKTTGGKGEKLAPPPRRAARKES
jgi:hypothetical protein